MSNRYYFNPYVEKPVVCELTGAEDDKVTISCVSTLKRPFEEFLTKEEVYALLETLLKTKRCFGKFDLFNKWRISSIKIRDSHTAKQMQQRARHVMLKPVTYCAGCSYLDKCSVIRIPLDELRKLWEDLYFSRASIFDPKEDNK